VADDIDRIWPDERRAERRAAREAAKQLELEAAEAGESDD